MSIFLSSCKYDRNFFRNEPNIEELLRIRKLQHNNYTAAISGFRDLARRGSAMSMFYLGESHRWRISDPDDIKKSEYWYKSGEKLESIHCTYGLGALYCLNNEYSKAKLYLEEASSKNFGPAMGQLGYMYYKGLGVQKNYDLAKKYWEFGFRTGNLNCHKYLAFILLTGRFGKRQKFHGCVLQIGILFRKLFLEIVEKYTDNFRYCDNMR